jgi:GNAT superfamily N-acetyltransferase
MRPAGLTIQRCGRLHVLGLCLLNHATFPKLPDEPTPRLSFPGARLARDWWSLQRRVNVNHIVVATRRWGWGVAGSVEVHSTPYLQQHAGANFTDAQLKILQPYLCSMAVAERERGKGVGRALVEAVLEEARAKEAADAWVLLQVEATNAAALHLYETCGFEVVSAPGCQVHLMRRRLAREPGPVAGAEGTPLRRQDGAG